MTVVTSHQCSSLNSTALVFASCGNSLEKNYFQLNFRQLSVVVGEVKVEWSPKIDQKFV